jgi:hypothetical protein
MYCKLFPFNNINHGVASLIMNLVCARVQQVLWLVNLTQQWWTVLVLVLVRRGVLRTDDPEHGLLLFGTEDLSANLTKDATGVTVVRRDVEVQQSGVQLVHLGLGQYEALTIHGLNCEETEQDGGTCIDGRRSSNVRRIFHQARVR